MLHSGDMYCTGDLLTDAYENSIHSTGPTSIQGILHPDLSVVNQFLNFYGKSARITYIPLGTK